ncbi:vWA domain-containing protein [Stieleria varia]|uniref:von Willebrand factor type A domain protein n=1 Tax=Stieleria varia TaxID=2528005 RepID=A0A5C6ASZ6_9BACT|nr:VWA domain-containing protein [Stieleria varia]TWU02830.1 von Willebrand factor type A domain protein [Stieleria varia]
MNLSSAKPTSAKPISARQGVPAQQPSEPAASLLWTGTTLPLFLRPVLRVVLMIGALSVALTQGTASAEQIDLDVSLANPMMLSGEKEINYLRISLTGFEQTAKGERAPVNTAIVIDNSSSMSGSKIEQARKAAIQAVERLDDNDIVSIVLYNSSATVLVPATKATDRESIIEKIRSVKAQGSTALFAGVSKGAAEVRKFLSDESVNRVILLSDGKANIGPSSPRELEQLGASLVKEGISVSTLGLGLGYNEDLMSRLASAGSGNHFFIEEADDLIAVFNNEFNDLMSVVATEFEIHARLSKSVRPVRVLGTKANIIGQDIHIPLVQLYSKQQRYFVVEVEVTPGEPNESLELGDVSVEYQNLVTNTRDKLSSAVNVRFTDDESLVKKNRNHETYAYCTIQIANERNVRATALRDAGQIDEAKQLLNLNGRVLAEVEMECKDLGVAESVIPQLKINRLFNSQQAQGIENDGEWVKNRKSMRAAQSYNSAQQRYEVKVPDSSSK